MTRAGRQIEWYNSIGFCKIITRRFNTMLYQVVLHKSEEGYSVSCPGLPGCWSQGETEEEALENIQDAIFEYRAAISEMYPQSEIREVEVAA